jgi:putative FmdB family regulatory protein
MPIYEYECKSCGHELEKLQRMNDPTLTDCPACNEPELKRLVSAAGFRLKGAGWYETDFKKDGKKNLHDSAESGEESSTSKDSDSKASPETSDSKTSDTKSAGTQSSESKASSTKPGKGSGNKADAA